MANPPIPIIRSAPLSITFTITDDNAAIVDLTGAAVLFAVKEPRVVNASPDGDSQSKILVRQEVHTDAVNGITTIELSNVDTDIPAGEYVYGIKVIPAAGEALPSGVAPFLVKPRGVAGI